MPDTPTRRSPARISTSPGSSFSTPDQPDRVWTKCEEKLLAEAVANTPKNGGLFDWVAIATKIKSKDRKQCRFKYYSDRTKKRQLRDGTNQSILPATKRLARQTLTFVPPHTKKANENVFGLPSWS